MVSACVGLIIIAHLDVDEEHHDNHEKPYQQAHKTAVSLLKLVIQGTLFAQSLLHLFLGCSCVSPRVCHIVLYLVQGHALSIHQVIHMLIQLVGVLQRVGNLHYFSVPVASIVLLTGQSEFVIFFQLKHLLSAINCLF